MIWEGGNEKEKSFIENHWDKLSIYYEVKSISNDRKKEQM